VVYTDLKLRFSVGVGLVNEIAGPLVCSWYRSFSAASRGRYLVQLGQAATACTDLSPLRARY
jgi:hypothetical protein